MRFRPAPRRALALPALMLAAASLAAQDRALEAKVDAYLAPYAKGGNFLGAVLIAQGDRVLVSRAYGEASCELHVANSPATRFHIASVSKPFTAAAVLLLEERGRLRVSDPLARFLPDFPEAERITLENLLTHTSGITNVNNLPEYATASRFPQTPRSLVELFRSKPLGFAPGSKYEYSNSNYNLLALVIEQVTQKPYGDFLREAIFAPAGLRDTGHDGDASEVIRNAASGYQPRGTEELERSAFIDWSAKTGNGSLYSTTGDLLRFLRAYRDGKILSRATVDRVWTEKPGNNFGWFVRKRQGFLAVGSNGRSPGFTSSLEYFPEQDVTVIVLSNSYSPVSQSPVAEDLAALALGRPPREPAPAVGDPGAQRLDRLRGTYRFDASFFRPNAQVEVRVEGKQVVLDWGEANRSYLIPVGPAEFIDRQFWTRVAFDADGAGFCYGTAPVFQARKIPAP